MRTITKLMMTRTVFDSDAPRIQDMHTTTFGIFRKWKLRENHCTLDKTEFNL